MDGETPSVDDSNAADAGYGEGVDCSRSVATNLCMPTSFDVVPAWPLALEVVLGALPVMHAVNRCFTHCVPLDRHTRGHFKFLRRLGYEISCWRAVEVDEDGLEHAQDWESDLLACAHASATTLDGCPSSCKIIPAKLDVAFWRAEPPIAASATSLAVIPIVIRATTSPDPSL